MKDIKGYSRKVLTYLSINMQCEKVIKYGKLND